MTRELLATGEDGIVRCGWVTSHPEYQRYHDEEWGVPVHGDNAVFEMIALEGFQAGLSWLTILTKRPAFRAAFHDFDISSVADLTNDQIDVLAADSSIIRNRQKILATRSNARLLRDLVLPEPGALDDMVWRFAPERHNRPVEMEQLLSVTTESLQLSHALRAVGLKFVGPVTMHALMQAGGLLNDHAEGCPRGDQLSTTSR